MTLLEIVATRTTSEQWSQITTTLIYLWCFVGSIVMFAGSLLLGHGIIPSLVSTRDLPPRYISLRPPMLVVAAIFLLVAVFCFVNFVTHMTVVYDLFNRVWV
jgi:hypothetical protein